MIPIRDRLLPRIGLGAYPLEKRRYLGLGADEDDPNSAAGLDARTSPIRPAAPPTPKEPTPKTAPGTGDPKLPEPAPLPKNSASLLPQKNVPARGP